MTRIQLAGVDGSNPLGFLAALGILRVIRCARLGFSDDGSYQAFVEGRCQDDLVRLVTADAVAAANKSAPWRFTYTKAATKKQGPKEVADLKPPPDEFKRFLATSIDAWLNGDDEAAAYAAAYATDVAVDGNGNTKPTAFHFTAAQQTFLGAVEEIRASVTQEWVKESLFNGYSERQGSNLRWEPGSERNWALMEGDPSKDKTRVNAPLEWLAFRGLSLLPSFPRGSRILTSGVFGRGDDMRFVWPLWFTPASAQTIRSTLQVNWTGLSIKERRACSVFAICRSTIRRTSQGFGNFSPPEILC
ncbi:MAG: hypothetical protein QJR02_03760 [Sinobacteraceae bacterium]|nr:hypothetical protein [Nevskiaceae bacterium]